MGRSVDWLDVYNDHGPEAVAAAIRAAPLYQPHAPSPQPPTAEAGRGAGTREIVGIHIAPPPEMVLPGQAGPRATVVLERIFNPKRAGEAWHLRRFGGAWYVYTTAGLGLPRWRKWEDEALRAAVREELEKFWTAREVAKGGIADEHGREWKYSRFAPTDRVVQDIMVAAVHRLAVRCESVPAWLEPDFDAEGIEIRDAMRWRRDTEAPGPIDAGRVIAFRNGLLDVGALAAGEVRLLPHTSRWFSASTLDSDLPVGLLREEVRADDEGDLESEAMAAWLAKQCPAWLDFIAQMSMGSEMWIEALQRLIGYLMTLDTSLDVIGWIQGQPGSGKGTLTEAIEAVVGEENVARTDLDRLARPFGVAPLVGKNVAVISEMHVSSFTNTAAALQMLKSISGGDAQQVEDKFVRSIARVRMTVKFLITPNEEPRLPDASAALMRRLVVLPVLHRPEKADPGLSERLRAERAGIRVWAVLGLRRLWRDVAAGLPAFSQPEDGRELLMEIEAASSPMKVFLREKCVVGVGNSVTADALWTCWKSFREEEELSDNMARQTFGRQLRAAVPGLRKEPRVVAGKRVKVYVGVRPLFEGEEPGSRERFNNVRFDGVTWDSQVPVLVGEPVDSPNPSA